MQIMPHKDPMLLVDRSELTPDGVVSEYTIPDDPYFTHGHFPGNPIVPGVILCEIMAKVVVRSTMGNCRGMFLSVNATAYVGDELCASGLLSFMLVDK